MRGHIDHRKTGVGLRMATGARKTGVGLHTATGTHMSSICQTWSSRIWYLAYWRFVSLWFNYCCSCFEWEFLFWTKIPILKYVVCFMRVRRTAKPSRRLLISYFFQRYKNYKTTGTCKAKLNEIGIMKWLWTYGTGENTIFFYKMFPIAVWTLTPYCGAILGGGSPSRGSASLGTKFQVG